MRVTAWTFAIALIIGAPVAQAQQAPDVPEHVQRIAVDALDYVSAMRTRENGGVIEATDRIFNAPPSEIAASIQSARAINAADQARITALPIPNLRGQDIDLTFATPWLRERTLQYLATTDRALSAAQAMLDAQAVGDCTAMTARTADLERLRIERRFANNWTEINALEQAFSQWAPANRRQGGVAVDPPPAPPTQRGAHDATILDQITRVVARGLRCPLPAADTRVEITVRVQPDGTLSATVSGGSSALREALVQHVATSRITASYALRNSLLVSRPIRLIYANQRLTAE